MGIVLSFGPIQAQEHSGSHEHGASGNNEHRRDKGEAREGEEEKAELSKTAVYDVTKKGLRLYLAYNVTTNAFEGYLENMGTKAIKKARVEVHLDNGIELGPTPSHNLSPKQKLPVNLKASRKPFKLWSAHAEQGSNEHAHTHG
ncbi:hypothetical protein B7P33_04585 [Sediminicola luteus]|uniref:Uncharacterized protein n=2 Tax=Sediminicola luteus TaxID=319238 RepID=A0A2A4GC96_9FLAO|nr:hypothetical protein B7P33_04585 [Sediminicola luteus]